MPVLFLLFLSLSLLCSPLLSLLLLSLSARVGLFDDFLLPLVHLSAIKCEPSNKYPSIPPSLVRARHVVWNRTKDSSELSSLIDCVHENESEVRQVASGSMKCVWALPYRCRHCCPSPRRPSKLATHWSSSICRASRVLQLAYRPPARE